MRLFAALVPPPPVLDEAETALADIRGELPDLRWAPAERMHLTLAFYGDVDERTAERLRERLARATARYGVLALELAGAGAFPSPGKARVFWLGVQGDTEPLVRLAGSLGAAGRRVGLEVDERRYRPHLTVGRARRPCDVRAQVQRLAAYQGQAWQAAKIALVRSHLGPAPRYETVATWPFAGNSLPP